jgi:hypothetical protein
MKLATEDTEDTEFFLFFSVLSVFSVAKKIRRKHETFYIFIHHPVGDFALH